MPGFCPPRETDGFRDIKVRFVREPPGFKDFREGTHIIRISRICWCKFGNVDRSDVLLGIVKKFFRKALAWR